MKNRVSMITRITLFSAMLAFALTSCQKTDLNPVISESGSAIENKEIAAPEVPDIIAVPDGNKVLWVSYASGVQIYEVTYNAFDPNHFAWTLVGPEAILYEKPNFKKATGAHYVGPTWVTTTGENAGKFVMGGLINSHTEDASAIPWLLLHAMPVDDPYYYSEVTYIHRLYTTGGLAPTTPATADNLGERRDVPYTAAYYFYGAE